MIKSKPKVYPYEFERILHSSEDPEFDEHLNGFDKRLEEGLKKKELGETK